METNVIDETKTFTLTPFQNAVLKKALTEGAALDYIHDDLFDAADAEAKVFAVAVPKANADWYAAFVNDMGRAEVPTASNVLTKEQEAALFFQYNYSKLRLKRAVAAYNAADEASAKEVIDWNNKVIEFRTQLVNHNLALVLSLVRQFNGSNLDFDEMLSEGNTILLNAVNKYNAGKGFKFSTYATWSVERAFGKASEKKDRSNKFFPVSLDLELQKSDYVDRKREEQVNDGVLTLREILSTNSAGLTAEEMTIIKARYPQDASTDFEKPTLEELGQKLNRNKSNMSRIEKRALAKIKEAFQKTLV